ncbi:FecR domain-containing protein [Thauera sp.]|uniref:FecR domain-containing protein n=1 Tax=Thauera sp. TaxID=1905334 RepID=UPI002CCADA0A|nr:FecR domain-containing protein [Thauera sp.]HRP23764.1 FecR domain-containing protein [Thauera sp.]
MQACPPESARPARARATLLGLALAACCNAALAQDVIYVVRPGDNPWNITQRYLKSIDYWPRIQDYNRILDPLAIQPGTRLRIPVAWMRGDRDTARVLDMRGTVERWVDGTMAPLAAGMTLAPGTHLRSGADGSLTLEFADGSRSLVGNNTELRLDEIRRLRASGAQQVHIELQQGHVESAVTPGNRSGGRFMIQTPAALAAVRGTDFRVSAEADGVRAETLEGEVALRNSRGVTRLPAGTGTFSARGRAPEKASALLPAPELDTLPERLERVPFRVPIAAVEGARGYRTQIAPLTGFSAIESDRSGAEAAVLGHAGLADGSYRLRVRAIDGRGLEGVDAERSIVIDARPEPPFPSLPAPDGFATDEGVAFAWAANADAERYHFELARDAHFQDRVLQRDDLTAPGLVLDEALAAGDYFWRIAVSTAAEGRGPFSDVQRFHRPPPGPVPEAPDVDGYTLHLRWRASDGAQRYQVQLSSAADFAAPEYELDTQAAELSIATPPAGVWHVRIRSQEAGSPPGPWGKAQQIEVPHTHWRALLILLPLLLAL